MMARSSMNYGIVAFGYVRRNGELHERLGSAGVRHFDQRFNQQSMHAQAKRWAQIEKNDAYRLHRCYDGYRSARPVGPVVEVTRCD